MAKASHRDKSPRILRRRQQPPPVRLADFVSGRAASPPATPATPAPIPPPPPPSSIACSCDAQISSAQASASQNIASVSAAAASSVSSAQAAQASLQQSIVAANSALQSIQTSYSQALSSATAYANSVVAAQESAQQSASAALTSVQNSASFALSLAAASSASSAIASATSQAFVAQSSASLAISSAGAAVKTAQATATSEAGEDTLAIHPSSKAPTSSAIPTCNLTSTTALRVIMAVLSTILLFLFAILLFVLVTHCREHRKEQHRRTVEAVLEVKEAREMKPHDVDLLCAKPGFESCVGSSVSYYRRKMAPISPITSPMKPPPLFSQEIKRSKPFLMSQKAQLPPRNTLGISREPSERRPSTPVPLSLPSFILVGSKRSSSPTVSTHILSQPSMIPPTKKPSLQIMIPNRASTTTSPSRDVSLSQFPRPQDHSLTHPSQVQKIFWSFPLSATEPPPHPAFASSDSTPSFGFQNIPTPLSPNSTPLEFTTHRNLRTNSITPVNSELRTSKSLSALKGKAAESTPEMRQRSKSVKDKTVSMLIGEIDALSRDQERRRRIEGWLDAPGWGEGSVKSAATGQPRIDSVTTVYTTYTQDEDSDEIQIGEAF